MPTPPINGTSKVTDAFGYFPTFHDAEIIKIYLDRNTTPKEDYPTVSITFVLHGWEMTSDITPSGHYRLTKHHLIKFQFDSVDEVDLRYFNHQNVISELAIEAINPVTDHALLRIDFGSCYGLEGGFRASSGSVIEVTPCDVDANPITKTGEQVSGDNGG
ncbi:hypothetical protein BH11VER1_BH11VER1_31130 [soil metagenome]